MTTAEATCSAPINLAIIKYWGKRDTKLILPTNSSLSVTLSQDNLKSTTSIRADSSFESDRIWLNGTEDIIKDGSRLKTCIDEMRSRRAQVEKEGGDSVKKLSDLHIHIISSNNFPTAAGLASSASGFAALVSTLAKLYELPYSGTDLSLIARQGSGSACRSVLGGFVAWEMGTRDDGSDSKAVQIAPRDHWDDLEAIICVVNDAKKGTGSTVGMQRTVETSPLLQHRIKNLVPGRMNELTEAIKNKDFDAFAQLAMKDSNNFHACCLDTEPPIFYLSDASKAIISLITERNNMQAKSSSSSSSGGDKYFAAYTFDAGPNAVIFTKKSNVKELINLVTTYFPLTVEFEDPANLFTNGEPQGWSSVPYTNEEFNSQVIPHYPAGSVSRIIHTSVGDGPRQMDASESLINEAGLPKKDKL